MGSGGENCYLNGFLRCSCNEAHNIDSFHANCKVMSCFLPENRPLALNILGTFIDNCAEEAAVAIERAGAMGIANKAWPDIPG